MDGPIRIMREDRVIDYFPAETPESLYVGDSLRMNYEAHRRSLDPETLALMGKIDAEVERTVLGLPKEEAA